MYRCIRYTHTKPYKRLMFLKSNITQKLTHSNNRVARTRVMGTRTLVEVYQFRLSIENIKRNTE